MTQEEKGPGKPKKKYLYLDKFERFMVTNADEHTKLTKAVDTMDKLRNRQIGAVVDKIDRMMWMLVGAAVMAVTADVISIIVLIKQH